MSPLVRLSVASGYFQDMADVGDAALGHFVGRACEAGHSWSEIGEALGVSKQAAQQCHTARRAPDSGGLAITPRAGRVLEESGRIARDLGHGEVAAEHLLAAMYVQPKGMGAQILADAGLSVAKVRTRLQGHLEEVPWEGSHEAASAERVVRESANAALGLGRNYVGIEHLLAGVLREQLDPPRRFSKPTA
ncbi:MAG: Clp protease N-terminal domain-containing protein [Acidimicrobiales bacterium]